MSVALSAFIPDLVLSLPGCSNMQAERAVLLAAIRMAREGLILQEDLADITVTAGDDTHTVDTPSAETTTCAVVSAKFNDTYLTPLSYLDIDSGRNIGAARTDVPGNPFGYLQYKEQEIVLLPAPIAAGTLKVRVAFAPSDTATTIDDLFGGRHRDALLSGAFSQLLVIPKQSFTDTGLAAYHKGAFEAHIARERGTVTIGFSRAPLRVVPAH